MNDKKTDITATIVKLLEGEGFSPRAVEYYLKQINVGRIKEPSASFVFTGPCGDTVEIYLLIKGEVIEDAKFITTGCSASFCSGSALTEILKGKTLKEAEEIEGEDILKHLGGSFPAQKVHCVHLVKRVLEEALAQYRKKHSKRVDPK
ncbi:iron-sulfur cluster assembly scaffold protein [bacterium]|nr:iron-sulfur cluster assembly scaffold protein [bacterium]